MVLSRCFVYRWGQRIKDFGERMGHIRVFGIHIFRWCCGAVIGAGLAIKGWILENSTIGELER